MTQQPAREDNMALSEILTSDPEVALNWRVLRDLVGRDLARWQAMADSGKWHSDVRAGLLGRVEAARQILDTMCTLEFGADVTLSFPLGESITTAVLAEHTAAACDTITRAAR